MEARQDWSDEAISQGMWTATQSSKRQKMDFPIQPLECEPAGTLISDFGLWNCEGMNFCCIKPLDFVVIVGQPGERNGGTFVPAILWVP